MENQSISTIIVNLPFVTKCCNLKGSNINQIISHLEVENHILPIPY